MESIKNAMQNVADTLTGKSDQTNALTLRWGICSAGKISEDFMANLAAMPKQHKIVAIAAESGPERANQMAAKFNIAHVYDSYAAIAQNPDVDIAYIGVIHPGHYEACKTMILAKKHVLCEKPLTLLLRHTEELLRLAKENGKFFMEGCWSRCFPAYKTLYKELNNIGDTSVIAVQFCKRMPPKIARLHVKSLGGGVLMDIGVYTIQAAMIPFGTKMPDEIYAHSVMENTTGVDITTCMTLKWGKDKIAHLVCSSLVEAQNDAVFGGTKGHLKLNNPFWAATSIDICTDMEKSEAQPDEAPKTESYPLPPIASEGNFANAAGMTYEIQEVYACIAAGKTESSLWSHEHTLTLAKILDQVQKQIGLSYEDCYQNDKYIKQDQKAPK